MRLRGRLKSRPETMLAASGGNIDGRSEVLKEPAFNLSASFFLSFDLFISQSPALARQGGEVRTGFIHTLHATTRSGG